MLALLLALAMQATPDLANGAALYSQCKAYVALVDKTRSIDSDAMLDAGTCLGYISGFTDVVATGSSTVCLKPVTTATLVRVYIAYMDKNPKLFDESRKVTLALALTDAYPCPVT
jgi:Rap1a immunity proteins